MISQQQQQQPQSDEAEESINKRKQLKPVLVLSNNTQPIYLNEDWTKGIGGGLWSMGIALAKYLDTKHAQNYFRRNHFASQQQQNHHHHHLKVLELGSGNGFLSVCLLATLRQQQQHLIVNNNDNNNNNNNNSITLHITDTLEHLPLIESTLKANDYSKRTTQQQPNNDDDDDDGDNDGGDNNVLFYSTISDLSNSNNNNNNNIKVYVEEYVWGSSSKQQKSSSTNKKYYAEQEETFDLIIGSDLAYRDELHDILIESILDCSSSTSSRKTITLLGVTMNDTKPIFFKKLSKANLQYERLADHLIDPDYRGSQFGIFVIVKK